MLHPALICDFYKLSHRAMYPAGTELIYSTWTPRASRLPDVGEVVALGFQKTLADIHVYFQEHFFDKPKALVLSEYAEIVRHTLGDRSPYVKHLEELHDLGYLPIEVRALAEGTLVPLRVPMMTVHNTDPRFFWLTNYLETWLSTLLWPFSTSATLALRYRKLFEKYAALTGSDKAFVDFQGHDFSMRGMSSINSAISSGIGHLTSFTGTDTIPAIQAIEAIYDETVNDYLIGTSIPASEHSVQCAYGDDLAYLKRVITEVHPMGLVSIVADGYDFWRFLEYAGELRSLIMAREGKVVIRPDSGDPVKIVCGDDRYGEDTPQGLGAIECLWNIFGGTVNEKGYKELDPHIGLIYGDAITYERAEQILEGLKRKCFASSNIVFGIGSYTYQYTTRDTFGFAMKSTLARINGQEIAIFKDPKTDDGIKKSHKGRVIVRKIDGQGIVATDGHKFDEEVPDDLLKPIYCDGRFNPRTWTHFSKIRERLKNARG